MAFTETETHMSQSLGSMQTNTIEGPLNGTLASPQYPPNSPEEPLQLSPALAHPPSYTIPVAAPKAAPWKKFSIQTKTDALSSGFPYNDRLESLKISHDQWFQFSSEIVQASKITFGEDYIAWTTGITTGTLTSPFLLVFAPWAGYYAGRKYHRKAIEKKVQERLIGDGDIRTILRRWNESTWADRGFSAWLQLPDDPKEVRPDGTKSKKRRFRIVLVPTDEMGSPIGPSSSWSMNGSSVGTPLAIEEQHQEVGEISPPSPPPAFDSNPDSKSAAFTTSPPQRANESRPGPSASGPSASGTSATQEARFEKIRLQGLPDKESKSRHELPGERDAAELQ